MKVLNLKGLNKKSTTKTLTLSQSSKERFPGEGKEEDKWEWWRGGGVKL